MSNHALMMDEDFREDCRSAGRRDEPETAKCVGCEERFNIDELAEVDGKCCCFKCYETTCDDCGREATVDEDHLCYICARPELHGARS